MRPQNLQQRTGSVREDAPNPQKTGGHREFRGFVCVCVGGGGRLVEAGWRGGGMRCGIVIGVCTRRGIKFGVKEEKGKKKVKEKKNSKNQSPINQEKQKLYV
jgi:hypothetical protein